MSDDRPQRPHDDRAAENFSLGSEPSPLNGAARDLAKVGVAVGVLVAAAAVVAGVVALLY